MNNGSQKNITKPTRDGIEDAVDTAADAMHREAENAVDAATARAVEEAETAADAAEAAAREFDTGSLQAQAGDHIANGLGQVAGALRDTDLNQAVGQVSNFARQNPALFLGGAALLGFAAVRFLKSSDPERRDYAAPEADPWTGHVSATPAVADDHPAANVRPAGSAGYTNGAVRS